MVAVVFILSFIFFDPADSVFDIFEERHFLELYFFTERRDELFEERGVFFIESEINIVFIVSFAKDILFLYSKGGT